MADGSIHYTAEKAGFQMAKCSQMQEVKIIPYLSFSNYCDALLESASYKSLPFPLNPAGLNQVC